MFLVLNSGSGHLRETHYSNLLSTFRRPYNMAESRTDAVATTLLGEVTPVLSRLAERVEALQQPQSELLQTLRDSPLMDEAALANVETTIGQIPAYHEKLVTLQADMLQLATRTASMRQRSAHLASQASHSRIAAHSWRVWCAAPTHCTVHALPPRRGLERAG